MGYTTDFSGEFELNKPLTEEDNKWLENFAQDRHEGKDYPSYYCQWVATDDTHIGWDGGEKFYEYVEWIEWLIKNFFSPKGYILNGTVNWAGEEHEDLGLIEITDNVVKAKIGRVVYD